MLSTVSEARNTAAPAWNISPKPNGTPYSRATNSTATAWNSALPARFTVAPSGSTKLDTMREILRSFAAASSIVGSVARDDVVENPISMEGKLARRNRLRERRTISAIAGRYTPTMKIASPTITASTYTAIALTSDHPNCATAPATSAKIPTGATSSTHRTMRISAWVGIFALVAGAVAQ